MKAKRIITVISFCLMYHLCNGQVDILDSCGRTPEPKLNEYEIAILDSLFFAPFNTKKAGVIDPKDGFDFSGKKVAFFSCTKWSNTKGNGLLSKVKFFEFFKPRFIGHAGRGLIKFNEREKLESGGFDAVIIIDCPYYRPPTEAILKLVRNSD